MFRLALLVVLGLTGYMAVVAGFFVLCVRVISPRVQAKRFADQATKWAVEEYKREQFRKRFNL